MRLPANHIPFTSIEEQGLQGVPAGTEDFRLGYRSFFEQFGGYCFIEKLQNWHDDLSCTIKFENVAASIFQSIEDDFTRKPFSGDLKEFWRGCFHAQQFAQSLFELAYTQDVEVA